MHLYWSAFITLLATPFEHMTLVWGIVPLYFGWLFNEITSSKANFRTAVQTGFSFLWAAAQWLYPFLQKQGQHDAHLDLSAMQSVKLAVTALVVILGITALICGLRKHFPPCARFLGHTRFANYFMITIYPMQFPMNSHGLPWTWLRLETILLFAVPVWLLLSLLLIPVRK